MFHDAHYLLGCKGVQKSPEMQLRTPTEPRDVFVVPGERLLAGGVQRAAARHPPEGVHMGAHVKISSPQQTHASETLFSWRRYNEEHMFDIRHRERAKSHGSAERIKE